MSKATADRNQRQLVALLKEPGNDQCADCKARNPRWASWDQGVFLCVQCASMHRKIGSHITKVKSVTLDTWTPEQVDNMKRLGNTRVNQMLNPDERRHPPPPADSGDERNSELERFVRNKYEYRTFAATSPPLPPASNGHANGSSASPVPPSNVPTPRRTPTPTTAFAPPPNDPPPPPLPNRPQPPPAAATSPAPPSSSFDTFASIFGTSSSGAAAAPTLPSRPPNAHVPASAPPAVSGPKRARIASLPPTIIPSPPDFEDESSDDDLPLSAARPRQRLRTRSASVLPPRKGALRHRPGGGVEILVDWAAFTRDSALEPDGDDVPLASLGALGARGAQVGMVGVMQPQGAWAVPYGQPGAAMGAGAPAFGGGGGGGGQQPAVAPLLPQYTGSAKGYLHQQREASQQQQAPLQPQSTGIDAFQQMFQPRQQQQAPAPGPNPFQQAFAPPQQQQQQQQPTFARPQAQARTNPFHSHLFHRNAYSPSPQPPTPAAQPPPPPPPSGHGHDIWADLDLLGGPPQPPFFGGGGGSGAPSPSLFTAPTPSPSLGQQQHQQQPHAPAPLRPQWTGFVPSSSFGQQLARETGGAGSGLTLQIPGTSASAASTPRGSAPASPAPFAAAPSPAHSPGIARLEPQRTGFVPSSAFGQELLRSGGSPAPPQSLQPQTRGFASSSFASGSRFTPSAAAEPAPFDFPAPSSSQEQQGQQPNPFASLGASLGGALPPAQAQAQARAGGSPNPFALRPQVTGFAGAGGGAAPFMQPQVTVFGAQGGGGGGNPFLAFQQQQQQQGGGGWR